MRGLLAVSLVSAIGLSACQASKPASGPPAATAAPAVSGNAMASARPDDAVHNGGITAAAPGGSASFTGTVAEAMNAGEYTYARLHGSTKDDVWVAAPRFDARVGEQLSVSLDTPMQNFESKTLNRTFPLVYFVAEVAQNGATLTPRQEAAPPSLMSSHGAMEEPAAAPVVTRMDPPAGGLAIADVFAKRTALSGKTVTVRGTVVKFNAGILDRNWIHIQDGSGSAAGKDNDLTITSDAAVKVGDVITASGVLGINRDFGAGYAYDAMVEKASITR